MADHVRKQVRAAVGSALSGLPTTGARVFVSRVYPLEDADLPALRVSVSDEQIQPQTFNPPMQLERRLQIEVRAVAKRNSALDDVLDQICKEVEVALADPVAQLTAIAKTMTIRLVQITQPELAGTAEKPTGALSMMFEVAYSTVINAPDVAL